MSDLLSDALNVIYVARRNGKKACVVKPVSTMLLKVLEIMVKNKYLDKYEIINDARGGFIKVYINDTLNRCKAVRPRYPIKADDITKYEKRFLPAFGFGKIILSTNQGMITHDEAREKNVGGTLVAYVY